jgi:membrane protein implicated in regulation of membrane protease activity
VTAESLDYTRLETCDPKVKELTMEWTTSTLWWLVAAALVAAELATGTFYLLMLALGAASAALAAHAGLGVSGQLLTAALLGGGAVVLWHLRRVRRPPGADATANRDVNLDIGSTVHVAHWRTDHSARVTYRGAGWEARFTGSGDPATGNYVIRAVKGSCLMLDRD